jgi:hypothetical protein
MCWRIFGPNTNDPYVVLVVSSESPKSVLAPIRTPINAMRTTWRCSLRRRRRSAVRDRIVRDLAQMLGSCLTSWTVRAWWPNSPRVRRDGEVRQRRLNLAPGRDPSGRKDHRLCLGIGRPPKTSLIDVERL